MFIIYTYNLVTDIFEKSNFLKVIKLANATVIKNVIKNILYKMIERVCVKKIRKILKQINVLFLLCFYQLLSMCLLIRETGINI